MITAHIAKDFVKTISIFIPSCKPQITSTSASACVTGTTSTLSAVVQNTGSVSCAFDVSATCGANIRQVGGVQRINIGAGSSTSVSIPITTQTGGTETCTIRVQDANDAAKYVIATQGVSCTDIPIVCPTGTHFDPTQQKCVDDVIPCPTGYHKEKVNNVDVCVENTGPDLSKFLPYILLGGFGLVLGYALTRRIEMGVALGILGLIIAYVSVGFFASLAAIPIIGGFVSGLFGVLITGIIFLTIIGVVLKSAGIIQ